jgi:zinc protease
VQIWMLDKTGGKVSVSAQQQVEGVQFQLFQRTIVTSMLADAEDLVSRAAERALATHFSGEPLTYSRKLGAAMSLSSSSVADFANKYITRDRARVVLFTPHERAAAEAIGGVPPDPNAEPPPAAPDAETMRDFSRPLGASAFTEFDLPNGLDVIIAERSGLPVVTVGLSFRKGEPTVLGADALAAYLATPRVTTKVVPGQFGASYWDENAKDAYRYFMSGSAGNVNDMLSLLAEWVSGMGVTSEQVDFYKREVSGLVAGAEKWPEAQASRDFWNMLYPKHTYGQTPLAGDLVKLEAGDVRDWIRATHTAKNATLVIVGEVNAQAVTEAVKEHFGGLSSDPARAAPAALPVPKGALAAPACDAISRPAATQLELSFGCRLPAPVGSLAAHRLAATLLGDRVHERLRKKLGASYGFHTSTTALAGGSAHLRGQGAVDNAHASQAIGVLKEELAALAGGPPSAAEMDRARWSRILGYAVSHQSTESIVEALLDAREADLPRTSLDRYVEDLLKVSPEAVTDLLRTCAAGPVLVAVGDESTAQSACAVPWK